MVFLYSVKYFHYLATSFCSARNYRFLYKPVWYSASVWCLFHNTLAVTHLQTPSLVSVASISCCCINLKSFTEELYPPASTTSSNIWQNPWLYLRQMAAVLSHYHYFPIQDQTTPHAQPHFPLLVHLPLLFGLRRPAGHSRRGRRAWCFAELDYATELRVLISLWFLRLKYDCHL